MSAAAIVDPLGGVSHRLGLFSVLVSTCAINLLSLALPIATLQIYDRVLHGQNTSTLQALVAGVVIAVVLETILRLLRSYIVCQRGASYAHGVGCAAMNAQLDARVPSAENSAVAADLASLNSVKNLKDFNSGNSLIVVIDLLFLPIFIVIMAYISHTLVLVPVALLCAFGVITALGGLTVKSQLEDASANDDKRYDFLISALTSAQLMKSYAMEMLLQRRFERLHHDSCASSYRLSGTITDSVVYGTVLGHVMTGATVAVGAYMAVSEHLSIGALIAVVQLSSRLMQPVQKAVLYWIRFQDFQAARAKVERLFDVPSPPVGQLFSAPQNLGRIDVEQVAFRPGSNRPLLLESATFSIDPGQTVILDGPTGSGKSALLKLIAGIYSATSGTIKVNGAEATLLSPSELARHVGYLAPRSTLFRGTIRDNITRFNDAPIGQAMSVVRLLGLKPELDQLPLGIDTVVGTGSDTALSPGLVQMISIVRVLSSKPRIILFDDADNGLDSKYYNTLYALLGKLKPTIAMMIVSRDQNIRQLGNRLLTLSEGRLVELETRSIMLLRTAARM